MPHSLEASSLAPNLSVISLITASSFFLEHSTPIFCVLVSTSHLPYCLQSLGIDSRTITQWDFVWARNSAASPVRNDVINPNWAIMNEAKPTGDVKLRWVRNFWQFSENPTCEITRLKLISRRQHDKSKHSLAFLYLPPCIFSPLSSCVLHRCRQWFQPGS